MSVCVRNALTLPLVVSLPALSWSKGRTTSKTARPAAFAKATADRRSAKRGGWSTGVS